MANSDRSYLAGSIWLSRNEDGSMPEKYTIRSVLGEGGSTVCYEATRTLRDGTVETGKLKEFYPANASSGSEAWYYSLERLPNGQLVPGTGAVGKFYEMCEDYLGTYKLLRKVMADNPKNEILKSYIQHGEILYGCMEGKKAAGVKAHLGFLTKGRTGKEYAYEGVRPTVYIWSPGVPGEGFDAYLAEIRKNPSSQPEVKLQNILYVLDALVDCIKALHTAGLMHMDIKPSNFLVQYDSNFEIKPNRISLFDINTLCSVNSEFVCVSGSEGYCAPEVPRGKADNRSDIYSIGAMLFNAIVISRDIPDGLYRDQYYGGLHQLVRHSQLFQASETNSDVTLMARLCTILDKCLAHDPARRYMSCSELKADLDKARQRLTKLMWMPVKKSAAGLTDPTIVIQKLLYEHPLYEALPDGATDLNVLVIGSGTYGQRFIDLCLQTGQMSGIRLNITAVSDEPEEDKANYESFRPALSEFVSIDGSLDGTDKTPFASLVFRHVSQTPDGVDVKLRFSRSMAVNRELVKNLIESAVLEEKEYHYIFVALGSDRTSQSIARMCSDGLRDWWGRSCPVCYVSQQVKTGRKADLENKLYPVCINEELDVAAIDHRLGEMAFNTHISWNSSMNIDMAGERQAFFSGESEKDRYNRTSSLAYALSIKYKLHSVGIHCEDLLEAAGRFSETVLAPRASNASARKMFDRLVDLEHRRWVLEKAVDGWTAPRGENGELLLDECVMRGSVKDPRNRTHPCMVRGSETSPLSSAAYTDDRTKWDEGDIDPALDELDAMSVSLHRCFKRQADRVRQESLLQNPELLYIQDRIPPENESAVRAFKQFRFALKNILNGVESYSRQYAYYRGLLIDALQDLPEDTQSRIAQRLSVISRDFFPVIESNLYRNYKAYDEVLVEKIPFILTYHYQPALAVAFEDGKFQNGRNEAAFSNVAAATVLCPERICFLYYCDQNTSRELMLSKLDAMFNYFGKRKLRCAVDWVVVCLKETEQKKRDNIHNEFKKRQKKYPNTGESAWFDTLEVLDAADAGEASRLCAAYLSEHGFDLYDGGNPLFPSAHDNAAFIREIEERKIPYFEFDWRKKQFTRCVACGHLRYVRDNSFLRIQDMFALMNATDDRFDLPEFVDDYEALWDIYMGCYLPTHQYEDGVGNWNHLCDALSRYDDAQAPLARIEISTQPNVQYREPVYMLPTYTFSTVKTLMQRLKEFGVVDDFTLSSHTSDTCKLELRINRFYEPSISKVLANPPLLLPYYGINAVKYKVYNVDYVKISYTELRVVNVNLDPNNKGYGASAKAVLEQLEAGHFIQGLKQNPNNPTQVSFSYSSPRIKQLLTSAGMILEIYTYYDVLKSGYFDDVVTSYEFSWESGNVRNELDLVLTKGFRSVIVECKAVSKLELDYYHKLDSIADQFGIGTIKVLIGNTYVQTNPAIQENNAMQRSRGRQLQIRTISDENQIRNIGQTLKNMMEK